MELQEQIKIVAEARQKQDNKFEAKRLAMLEWENQNMTLLNEILLTAEIVAEAEAKLRELTLQVYAETGNKTPAPGVGIREVTKVNYNLWEALQWAIEHKMALKLDASSFEKIAKASPPEFVKITQEAQATISTDLSKYLTNIIP